MSDNEYERFEISDYDLANEFNINRPRRRQTKHQQIYGIWADDSDNEVGEGSTSRRRRGGGRGGAASKPKDYTAPVSFVAGGIQQSGKKKKEARGEPQSEGAAGNDNDITDEEEEEQQQQQQQEEDDDDYDDNARPSFGRRQPQLADLGSPASTEDSSADEKAQTPPPAPQRSSFAQKPPMAGSKNMGAWQQHTRGIGAKLLLQMGYQPGRGLGKDLQGISQPVEAHMRKGRGAIGAYGPEKPAKVGGDKSQAKEDDDVREAKEFKEKLNKWKKTGGPDKTKRYYYKSVEEVIEKGKKGGYNLSDKLSKRLANVPVIDMTGPEKRVLSGYHALGQSKIADEELYDLEVPPGAASKRAGSGAAAASAATGAAAPTVGFALPELMHNLQLIVSICEQDIIALDKTERVASDRQVLLEQDRQNLEEIIKLEQNHMDTLERALVLVEELTGADSETLTLARAEKLFLEMQHNYAAEYKEFGLGDLAAGVIAPLLKSTLEAWQPLEAPTQHVDTVKRWRTILDTNADLKTESRNVFDPYSSLVWAGVVPSFRACAATWNPKKQYQAMAALLDCWAPLFPTWILDSVLEQLVLPRLSTCVREWDPLTDTVPIHMWILPWNAILGHKMEEFIFPTIREKLGAALQAWMPQDRSARAMLTPWRGAFDAAAMQVFLMQHIIPKLQLVLSELIINPLQQDLEPWNQVWEWHELIPSVLMAQLLDKFFFPKWMQVLVLWLNQSPDYAEISRWYSGWKSMFHEDILREPNIKEHFRRALEMMHRATETVMAGAAAGIPPTGTPPPPPPPLPLPPVSLIDLHISGMSQSQLEFKELVSQKCAELGILFAPLPGRRELGKQVYRVGKLYCYIDRNVCMLSDSSFKNWSPSSLAQLLERAITGIM